MRRGCFGAERHFEQQSRALVSLGDGRQHVVAVRGERGHQVPLELKLEGHIEQQRRKTAQRVSAAGELGGGEAKDDRAIRHGGIGERGLVRGRGDRKIRIKRVVGDSGQPGLFDGAAQRAGQTRLLRDWTKAPELSRLAQLMDDADPDGFDRQGRRGRQPFFEQPALGERQSEAAK